MSQNHCHLAAWFRICAIGLTFCFLMGLAVACSSDGENGEEAATEEAAHGEEHEMTEGSSAPRIWFIQPEQEAVVTSPVAFEFGSENFIVEPRGDGEVHAGAGHHHIGVNTECLPAGELIPEANPWVHFGDGSAAIEMQLPPGEHTLTIQIGDGEHRTLDEPGLCESITINVVEEQMVSVAQEDTVEPEPVDPQPTAEELLVEALLDGDTQGTLRFLEDGADPNAQLSSGMPVLSYAALKGKLIVLNALLRAGAELEAKDRPGATALSYAAQFGDQETLETLLDAGANVSAADNLGWTPLIRAVVGGDAEAVKTLLAAGADKNVLDWFDRDALKVAEGRRNQAVIDALTEVTSKSES